MRVSSKLKEPLMRLPLLFLAALLSIPSLFAADSFLGDWKLNLEKSELSPNHQAIAGRTAFDKIETGGYAYSSDTAFAEGPAIRLDAPWKFDGNATDGVLNNLAVRCKA